MKKFIYSLMALLCSFVTVAKAQNNPCDGKANFQFTVNGGSVNFYSINTTSYPLFHSWHFGDGSLSDAANPVHTYQLPGVYRVVHYIKDSTRNCYDSAVKEITIAASCDLLQPKFEWRKDSSNPAKIIFMNYSQPNAPPTAIIYKWSFGDGTSSNEKSPVHLYSTPGQYNVCLTIRYANANCEKTYCSIVTVPPACDFQPYFSWTADPSNPLTIKFTNQTAVTSAAAKIKWSFGDGTSNADWNPTHTYTKSGVYNVCIRVELSPNCVKEFCKEVIVRSCDIEAGFTWVLDSVLPMRGVKFYPLPSILTVMPLSIKWSFGDGVSSTEYSPFHQYQQPGTYKVCMRIEFFAGCVKEVCKEVVIPAPLGCEQLSLFKIERISSEPNTFIFNAEFNNSTVKYTWTFGDGTGATGPNAKHKYDRPGRYNVCLTVYRGDNCASTTCKEIVVGQLNCEQTIVKYEYQRLNSVGNVIKFKAVSNQPILSQYWTIYKSNSTVPVMINAVDPTYTFQDSGWYKVCLRAITVNGCVKEYCEAIRIQQVPSVCTLQIMPNPVTTTANFKVQVETPQVVIASIIDITGVRKAVFYLNATAGVNSFAIPTGTLPTGYYTLEVKIGNRVCTGRFQKVN